MTTLELGKNEYGVSTLKCHLCEYFAYVPDGFSLDQDIVRRIHRHITSSAKKEAFELAMGEGVQTPHLAYFKEHTTAKTKVIEQSREYDNDLQLPEEK